MKNNAEVEAGTKNELLMNIIIFQKGFRENTIGFAI